MFGQRELEQVSDGLAGGGGSPGCPANRKTGLSKEALSLVVLKAPPQEGENLRRDR